MLHYIQINIQRKRQNPTIKYNLKYPNVFTEAKPEWESEIKIHLNILEYFYVVICDGSPM